MKRASLLDNPQLHAFNPGWHANWFYTGPPCENIRDYTTEDISLLVYLLSWGLNRVVLFFNIILWVKVEKITFWTVL